MFGYVKFDLPNLYIKDYTLYNAAYCGVCKGIKSSSGNIARFGLTYDMAFFSLILHNIKKIDLTITRQRCAEHPLFKKPMAHVDSLTESIGALNTVFLYYKCRDNVVDEHKDKFKLRLFTGAFRRAAKRYPEVASLVDKYMAQQTEVERGKTSGIDMAADNYSVMIGKLAQYFLAESATPYTYKLFYNIGKWIYLVDAVDDYDKDIKKGCYNPFAAAYNESDKKALINNRAEDINYVFSSIFKEMAESRQNIKFYFNADLIDNILFRGLPAQTKRALLPADKRKKSEKISIKENLK